MAKKAGNRGEISLYIHAMRALKKELRDLSGRRLVDLAVAAIQEKKGEEVVALDVRGLCSFADFFVIASGRSSRHVQGIAEAVDGRLGSKRLKESAIEGWNEGHWILLDYEDLVVHVFYRETRLFYDLEGLWHDAPRIGIGPAATSSLRPVADPPSTE